MLQNIFISFFERNDLILPANIYLFKVNNRNTRKKCEICNKKFTIKKPQRRQWRHSGVFVNFEHISHLFPVLLLYTLDE